MRFFRDDLNINFMGAKVWAILGSLIFISIGIVFLIVNKGIRYGVDFSGGTMVQIKFQESIDIDTLREGLKDLGLGELLIQRYGPKEENEVLLRMSGTTSSLEGYEEKIGTALKERMNAEFEIRRVEMVGPKVGKDLREKGMWAVIVAAIGILLYVWWRFEFVYGVGGIIALVHDVLVTMTAIIITNREFSLAVLAALLTIVGYSINDTIVIFDRVRENLRLTKNRSLEDVINLSINQTLGRNVLNSLTTLFVVVCLYVLGGEVINDFAFALLVGVVSGSYSTFFIASPVAIFFHNLIPSASTAGRAKTKKEMGAAAGSTAGMGMVNKGGVSRMLEQQKQEEQVAVSNPQGQEMGRSAKGYSKKRKKNRKE